MNNQDKNRGWIALHRSICDNDLWFLEPFTKAQAWIDLILNANHSDGTINIRGNLITIKRGQIGWSEITMSERWQWSRNKVRRFLKWLETKQQIEQQKLYKLTSVTTIVNYDKYQTKQQMEQQTIQQKDNRRYTNNNDNNVNNKYICSFDTFWENYPRKIGKRKANEKYIHLATSKQKEQEILEGLEQYLGKWKLEKTNLEYIPHPTTWLNQARWEDEVMVNRDVYNDFARKNENDWKQIKEKSSDPLVDDNGEMVKLSDILNKYSKKQ